MVLFTKEVFVQLKLLSLVNVYVTLNHVPPGLPVEVWSVAINGQVDVGITGSYDGFAINLQAQSKEDAYRIYKELMQQVVDSGSIPELNVTLFDDVLKEK